MTQDDKSGGAAHEKTPPKKVSDLKMHAFCFVVAGLLFLSLIGMASSPAQTAQQCQDTKFRLWLGQLYEDGDIVTKDPEKAATIYRQIANDRMTRADSPLRIEAQSRLAAMFRDGRGVEQSYSMAYYWYGFAADKDPSSAQQMKEMSAKISDEQRAVADAKRKDILDYKPKVLCTAPRGMNLDFRGTVKRLLPRAEWGRPEDQRILALVYNKLEDYGQAYFWASLSFGTKETQEADLERQKALLHLTGSRGLLEWEEKIRNWRPVQAAMPSDRPSQP